MSFAELHYANVNRQPAVEADPKVTYKLRESTQSQRELTHKAGPIVVEVEIEKPGGRSESWYFSGAFANPDMLQIIEDLRLGNDRAKPRVATDKPNAAPRKKQGRPRAKPGRNSHDDSDPPVEEDAGTEDPAAEDSGMSEGAQGGARAKAPRQSTSGAAKRRPTVARLTTPKGRRKNRRQDDFDGGDDEWKPTGRRRKGGGGRRRRG